MNQLQARNVQLASRQRMRLLADSSLPHLDLFRASFDVMLYENRNQLSAQLAHQDILVCRSTLRVDAELLRHSSIQCVATASSGVDHLDIEYLNQRGIHWLRAAGCNAESVADYVIATMAWLIQAQLCEFGCRCGVIGYGAVGLRVASRLSALGFSVCTYDPPKALRDQAFISCDLDEIKQCDVILIHANWHHEAAYPTHRLIDAGFLQALKPATVLINAARGDIVDERALLQCPHPIRYCTDVYQNEPLINPDLVDYATLCTPHIAGHSVEAKRNAVTYLLDALHVLFGIRQSTHAVFQETDAFTQMISTSDWVRRVLDVYNPVEESRQIKAAQDKSQAFTLLRKAHCNRHHLALVMPK